VPALPSRSRAWKGTELEPGLRVNNFDLVGSGDRSVISNTADNADIT